MGLAAAYLTQIQALLPPGAAWTRDPGATLTQLLAALAEEFARVDGRADVLMDESDPRTAYELLADWERVAGLPDACVPGSQTTDERRTALVARLAEVGGQSRQVFIALAARLGYTVTITEFRPHTCEHDCEHPVYDDAWAHAWRVNAPGDVVRESTCESSCEDPLRSWGDDALECAIARRAPAHTTVLFAYS